MSQSSIIVAGLLLGFVLFLAVSNRLTVYTGVLWGQSGSQTSSGNAPASTAQTGQTDIVSSMVSSFLTKLKNAPLN